MKIKIIKVKSEGLKDTAWKKNGEYFFPAYPLNVRLDVVCGNTSGALYLAPPTEKGCCHCIVPVWEGEEGEREEVVGPYINISSDELIKLGKLLIKIAQKHPRNKPIKPLIWSRIWASNR